MDGERQLLFANRRARKLLGFKEGEIVAGRCRTNTNGIDCEIACPLTFALEHGRAEVRDFETVYRGREGSAVPLRVTVVPLFDQDGKFSGAVEFLRERSVDPGFFLAGKGAESEALKTRLGELSVGTSDVILVGERSARQDVARTLHRFSAMGDDQFLVWPLGEDDRMSLSEGMCFADDGQASSLWESSVPEGWRRIFGVSDLNGLRPTPGQAVDIVHLPSPDALKNDLPVLLASWIERLREDLEVSSEAMGRLVEISLERGLDGVSEILPVAVAVANQRLDVCDLPQPSAQTIFIDRVLESDDPLGTLEHRLLTEVLERCDWRMQEAADRLGMSRVTLWRKTREYGIERPT